MIDHISFSVNNYAQSLKFYDETLKILGIERLMTFETPEQNVAGYGSHGKPFFWMGCDTSPNEEEFVGKARGFHIAFQAPNIEAIKAWHKKCLELGGKNNGNPGPRPEFHPDYYAAFIIDPNGWRLEAVLLKNEKNKSLS
ncbi:MAG: VOC family protein [Proteobacteria bacterium]|nr:VOC family protein [Pseudomonadota bacterium]